MINTETPMLCDSHVIHRAFFRHICPKIVGEAHFTFHMGLIIILLPQWSRSNYKLLFGYTSFLELYTFRKWLEIRCELDIKMASGRN